MARIKFKKKYPNLSESINEKFLDESVKDWIAKKLGYQKKPSPEELEAYEKILQEKIRQKYGNKAKDIISTIYGKGMSGMATILALDRVLNMAKGSFDILHGINNTTKRFITNTAHNTASSIIDHINSSHSYNWLSPSNLLKLDGKLDLIKDEKTREALQNSLDALKQSHNNKNAIGLIQNVTDLWNNNDYFKYGTSAAAIAALAGGTYLAGRKLYRKYKDKKAGKNKKLSEGSSALYESFDLPNLKKSKSARVIFNTLIKDSKLSESAIFAAYLSTPIGMRYGLEESQKYFKKFKKNLNENTNLVNKVKKNLFFF